MGDSSTVGVLLTDREGSGYHNRVGGIDGFVRLRPTDELRVQYLRSDTRYPDELAAELGREPGSFDDDAFTVAYTHQDRNWIWGASYDDRGPDFRADAGFVPRVDIRILEGAVTRRLWGGEDDRWTTASVTASAQRTEDHDGDLTDEVVALSGNVNGPYQSTLLLGVESTTRSFLGVRYDDQLTGRAFFEIQPTGAARFSLFARGGESVDFVNNR
ncbi:MAG: hypothetical protein ACLF0P_14290, partial [Thermoanaerobaculia bacterium]